MGVGQNSVSSALLKESLRPAQTQLGTQPCMRETQVVPNNVNRAAEGVGRFFRGHAAEISQLNEFSQFGIFACERFESAVQVQNVDWFDTARRGNLKAGQRFIVTEFVTPLTCPFIRCASPRVIDKHLPHDP